MKLNRVTAPWASSRGEAFRTTASLELLDVLVGFMGLMPEVGSSVETLGSVSLTRGTDNQDNKYLMVKLLPRSTLWASC